MTIGRPLAPDANFDERSQR